MKIGIIGTGNMGRTYDEAARFGDLVFYSLRDT